MKSEDPEDLPTSPGDERAVLGSILTDPFAPTAAEAVMPFLSTEDFFGEECRRIYGAIGRVFKRTGTVDLVLVRAEMNGEVDALFLSNNILQGEYDSGNVQLYARTVKEKARRRRLIQAFQKLIREASSQECGIEDLFAQAGAEIRTLGEAVRGADEAAQRSPLRSHTLAQLEAMRIPERELIVVPALARQETLFVHGPKGACKTWLGVGIATVAAQGGGARFLNFTNDGPGVFTLYVDGEMLSRDIRQRCRDVCRTSGLNPGDSLRIWTPDAQPEGTPSLNLFTEEGREMLERHIADIERETGRKVELVVIDNLRTLCPGWEENAAESFMPIAVWTIRLRARGSATILLHHSNKTGGYSGNTAIVSTVHAILKVARPKDYTADQGASFELTYEWTRAAPNGLENFSARLERDQWSLKPTGHVADELIRILTAQGLPVRAIAEQIGKGKDYVARARKRLGLTREAGEDA